ncbi:MAG: DEAD/DEAH box helicase, partial [Candidatus Hodarchaeales archaeon]
MKVSLTPITDSSVIVYQTFLQGALDGSIIHFLDIMPTQPILLAVVSENKLQIWMKQPQSNPEMFIKDVFIILQELHPPFYFFKIDEIRLEHYHSAYPTLQLKNWLLELQKSNLINYVPNTENKDQFSSDLSIWGHIAYEHYLNGFYHPTWYLYYVNDEVYGKKIVDYNVGMMYNKLALVIGYYSKAQINKQDIMKCFRAILPVTLNNASIIDLETDSVGDNARIVAFGLLIENQILIGFQKDLLTDENNEKFKTKMLSSCHHEICYSYNKDFESNLLPELSWTEIRESNLYQYTARRKTVWLPSDHDPGKGANVPIWFRQYQETYSEDKLFWRNLILLHCYEDLLTELALVLIKNINIPFQKLGHQIDYKTLKPILPVTIDSNRSLKKPIFHPFENFDKYTYLDGKYAELYKTENQIKLGLLKPDSKLLDIITNSGYNYLFYRQLPKQEGFLGQPIPELRIFDMDIRNLLESEGITKLYSYQETASRLILAKKDVIITAPTGNGKTEAFLIPTYQQILYEKSDNSDQRLNVIIFYPTKALASDQNAKISRHCSHLGITVNQIDGDTDYNQRQKVYNSPPDILITTPDLIHYNLHRTAFQNFIKFVKILIFDEIHIYDGIFGTHLFYLLWRLERFIDVPQYICASATVGNPREFTEKLFRRQMRLVECKKGKRPQIELFGIYKKKKYSALTSLVGQLRTNNYTTLIFRDSQQKCENTYKQLIKKFPVSEIGIHRGGYQKGYRQDVEQGLKNGILHTVVSTTTLELGID